ncbi:MAG: MBL fold metallo-hydrolase [Syntrophobacteraceae bacterium]
MLKSVRWLLPICVTVMLPYQGRFDGLVADVGFVNQSEQFVKDKVTILCRFLCKTGPYGPQIAQPAALPDYFIVNLEKITKIATCPELLGIAAKILLQRFAMEISILGSAGSEAPGQNPPAFLIDNFFLLDAGTVALSLDRFAQCRITHIFLTHAHFDHIKGIPSFVDNLVAMNQACQIIILSGGDVISELKRHIFNNRIWPDFTNIPSGENPVMRYQAISTRTPFKLGKYIVHASRVSHSVPAYGYLVEDAACGSLIYTGDTGPTEAIWRKMRGHDVKALIIEVSFPNAMSALALTTGHLTPSLLENEISKMPSVPDKIYISHLKPHYRPQIEAELARIPGVQLEILEAGQSFRVS